MGIWVLEELGTMLEAGLWAVKRYSPYLLEGAGNFALARMIIIDLDKK
jgi:hypothetical protein